VAQLRGKVAIETGVGIVAMEVPERALLTLLHDPNFTPGRGSNGEVGRYGGNGIAGEGIPVTVRKVTPRIRK
jgi:hypothetical protein